MTIEIKLRKGEPMDRAIRRMKKRLDREGVIRDVRAKRTINFVSILATSPFKQISFLGKETNNAIAGGFYFFVTSWSPSLAPGMAPD